MGKTLTSILTIAAAVAVNVIPGVGQFLSAAIGSTLATAAISAVTLAGLQSAIGLLGIGGGPKPDTTETAVKTPRPPRVAAYGRSRLYGAYCLFETASNGTAVDVYAVHDGQIDGIEARYLDDKTVVVGGDGTVATGTDGRYKGGAVKFYTTDGSIPGAGFPALEALLPGIWTDAHRGDGVAAIALTAKSVKAKNFQETYPSSTVPVASIVARWQKCPDPAAVDPLNEAAWTWTENPVRQLLHYKLTREGPRPAFPRSDAGYPAALAALRAEWWATKIAPTLQFWIDAAADCDSARALKAGGTEPKYRSAVAHKLTDKHQGPVGALLATFDGWLMPRADGALVVYSGKYYAPTVELGPEEIVSYTYDSGQPDEGEAVNEIIVSYISALHDYNTVEADAWRDEANIAKRGQVLSTPLEAQIPSHAQGRFLAKRLMQRKSAAHRGSVTTNIAGRAVLGERFINLHLEEAGTVFYSGPVEILGARRTLRGGVTFEWVAADANVDNWNPATEEGEPATVGERVASQPLETPLISSATITYDNAGARILVNATGPDRDDLQWYAHWREVGAAVWGADLDYTDTAAGAAVSLLVGPVPTDTDLEIQVAYQIGDGRYSAWSAAFPVGVAADLVAQLAERNAAVAVWNLGDRSTQWQDTAGTTTPVTAGGQPLGRVLDRTANGYDLVAPADARRPLTTDGATFDGVDDGLGFNYATAGAGNGTVVLVYKGTETFGVFLNDATDNSPFLLYVQSGDANVAAGPWGGVVKVDGVTVATRGDFYTAVSDGQPHVVTQTGCRFDLAANLTFSGYNASGLQVAGVLLPVAILDGNAPDHAAALTDATTVANALIADLGL